MLSGFLNFPLVYFTCLARFRFSSIFCIFSTCMAAGPFPDSSSALARLVQYSMLRASVWFFADFLPENADRVPVVISVSLMLDVTCGNWYCGWISHRPL